MKRMILIFNLVIAGLTLSSVASACKTDADCEKGQVCCPGFFGIKSCHSTIETCEG